MEGKKELKNIVSVILLPNTCGQLMIADRSGQQFVFYCNVPRQLEEKKARELVGMRARQCADEKRDADLVIVENPSA